MLKSPRSISLFQPLRRLRGVAILGVLVTAGSLPACRMALNPTPLTLTATPVSGTYQLTPSGGSAPYAYSVSGGAGSVDSGSGLFSVNWFTGTTAVTVTDQGGQSAVAALTFSATRSLSQGTAAADGAHNVATDAQGNIYVLGSTEGAMHGNALVGGADNYLAKYDALGNRLWTQQFGTAGTDYPSHVAVAPSGESYVVGFVNGSFDGNAVVGGFDIYLAKFTPAGVLEWSKQFGTASTDANPAVAVDPDGDVVVTFYGNGTFAGVASLGSFDLDFIKYAPDGTEVWSKHYGTAGFDSYMAYSQLAIDADGSIYFTGDTTGDTTAFGGAAFQGGTDDLIVGKLSSNGSLEWIKPFDGTSGVEIGYGIAVDADRNVIVAGLADAGNSFDGNAALGGNDIILVKLDTAGNKLWSKQLGTAGNEHPVFVGTDSAGQIYVTGTASGALGIDGSALGAVSDPFWLKLDASGNTLAMRQLGTAVADYVVGGSHFANGVMLIGGGTAGAFDSHVNAGGNDGFVIKLDASGARQ